MKRSATILMGALLLATAFAGCLGGDDGGSSDAGADDSTAGPSLTVDNRGTDSERARATVAAVAGDITYDRLVISVNGEPYQFATEASYEQATYTANGVEDASAQVSVGDVIMIPAAGSVDLGFRDARTGEVWDSYTVDVPDDDAPTAPQLQSPGNGESGVSRNPTFQWASVTDPSGVAYRIEVSLDKTFSKSVLVQHKEGISSTQYQMSEDNQLAPATTYYWHVRAVDSEANVGAWSPTWSFTTAPR